jgi:small multidrug resistance family-3 protein
MSRTAALLVLFAAAVLEAGGDALVRAGLHNARLVSRLLLYLIGGCVLFAYGWVVNAPPWDFGKLLGIYVVFFFVVAQLISFFAFGQKPSVTLLLGGALIVAGGLVIGLAKS